ncbi:phosphopantetheine-binding protein [Micromonospora sp. ATCC 39149]|uniref:Carrier domain-containing protein n=1 Tax=Micromonospora carbonacea TaxID=47853 RepID=A0A7D5YEQ0_9ACTN|nr:phosphopantetheine-binding protein [Micromonospora sp. ATCC 39149]QLJ97716.1 hypothetical protein HZU44_23535 [Micromonospora carbonacea]
MSEDAAADVRSTLGEMWQELLDVDEIRPQDRLLEVGGNSLIATMLANRIELTWGLRPPLETLLTCTFDELCKACAA